MPSLRPLVAAAALTTLATGPALGAWSQPEQASRGPLPSRAPDVAVNARGDAAAVWVRGARREAMVVASVRPAGGEWGAPEAISRRGRPAIDPEVAVDAQGRVIVAWRQVVRTRVVTAGAGRRRQAVYVVRTRDRAVDETRWSRISTLSSERQKVGPPELAVGDDGLALATWHWGTGTKPGDRGYVGQVQFAERRSDGSWSGPGRLSRSALCAQVRLPQVAVGRAGQSVIWWQCDLPADRSTVLARTRAASADDFGDEAELPFRTDGDVNADLAIDGTGRAVAVSADSSGTLSWWRGDVGASLSLRELPALGTPDRIDPAAGAVGAGGGGRRRRRRPLGLGRRVRTAPGGPGGVRPRRGLRLQPRPGRGGRHLAGGRRGRRALGRGRLDRGRPRGRLDAWRRRRGGGGLGGLVERRAGDRSARARDGLRGRGDAVLDPRLAGPLGGGALLRHPLTHPGALGYPVGLACADRDAPCPPGTVASPSFGDPRIL